MDNYYLRPANPPLANAFAFCVALTASAPLPFTSLLIDLAFVTAAFLVAIAFFASSLLFCSRFFLRSLDAFAAASLFKVSCALRLSSVVVKPVKGDETLEDGSFTSTFFQLLLLQLVQE